MYKKRDAQLLHDALDRYKYLVHRPYLYELSCFSSTTSTLCPSPIQILHIQSLPEISTYHYLTYILNALATLNQTIGCLLIAHRGTMSLYIMIKGECSSALSLLQNGLSQTFPDSEFYCINQPLEFLDDIFDFQKYSYLTSSVTVPNTTYSPLLLNQFTTLMGKHSNYCAFFLAQPIPRLEILQCLDELYELHDILSAFSQTNYTESKSSCKTVSKSTAKGHTNTSSEAATDTCSESNGCSHNGYVNLSLSTPFTLITQKANRIGHPNKLDVPDKLGISDNPSTVSPSLPHSEKSCLDKVVANTPPKNINATVLFNKAKGTSSTSGSSEAHCKTCGDSSSLTSTHGNSINQTDHHAFSYISYNKYIQDAIINLGESITRYTALSRNTAFRFGSYFFSYEIESSIRAGYSYVGLSDSSYTLSPNLVNAWPSNNPWYEDIYISLKQLTHPSFYLPDTDLIVSNTIPILSTELINSIYHPIT